MSGYSTTITSPERELHLRRLEPQRDLLQVADLIELCFNETLDLDGFSYLRQLRALARNNQWLAWLYNLAEQAGNVPLMGYVWEDDGRVVGNVSLLPIQPQGVRGYLIANVAVHPDYRNRGIGRALTAQAIEHARQRRVCSAWLQVRAENIPAVHIYSSLGFQERARRTTWTAKPELPRRPGAPGIQIAGRQSQHWERQKIWLENWFPEILRWQLSYNSSLLRPGLGGAFFRLFSFQFVQQWSVTRNKELLGVLAWLEDASQGDNLLMAAPLTGQADEAALLNLLLHARHSIGRSRALSLNCPADFLPSIFPEAGFYERQTLIWMEIPIGAQPAA